MPAEKLVTDFQKDFVLSLHGELESYLGCKIVQDLQKGTVTINQEKYANNVLCRFNMQGAKPVFLDYTSAGMITPARMQKW